ncbi:hypothetical protein NC652_001869 [Populus alba x Populus x berolinensis]|nr:hypothetical protein NC652_001869 [Populus alba x Populus x berolinensis]
MDMEKRAKARQRRGTRFNLKRLSYMEVEGELSTGESESDSETNVASQSTHDLLLWTAEEIFSDASSKEYSQLSVVKERFETWKKKY